MTPKTETLRVGTYVKDLREPAVLLAGSERFKAFRRSGNGSRRGRISYIDTTCMNTKAMTIPPPPRITSSAKFGFSLVSHQEGMSSTRER